MRLIDVEVSHENGRGIGRLMMSRVGCLQAGGLARTGLFMCYWEGLDK